LDENWQKSQKLVIITSTPDSANFRKHLTIATLGSFLKITNVAQIIGQYFPQKIICLNFDKKSATFSPVFSQTHLVTLAATVFSINDTLSPLRHRAPQ
jgi:hypothetical protein